jgi:single-strand DNA-binding protein
MANQIQIVQYEGFLAADPEMHYTPSGKAVTNFRMGSNQSYKNSDGEQVKETTWLKITVWGKYGEEVVNRYCGKGSHVIVFGRLRPGKNGSPTPYKLTDSEDWAASYEITATDVRIIKGKDNATPPANAVDDTGEIPF